MPGKIKIFIFLFSFLLALAYSLFSVLKVMATGPVPPYRVWCKDVKDPEFHSLRPYQTSPCGDPPKAIFCGNTLIFTETDDDWSQCESQASGEGKFICHVNRDVLPHKLAVNLEGGEFPILGNTQDIKNSQSSNETIDDSEKVNEYVSWYLSGVTDKAEYGQTDQDKIVDYSGPVKKLLPQAIQEDARIKTIETASTEVEITNENTGETVTDALNHNQIVVCAQEGVLGIWGKTSPHECYEGNGSKAKADVYRLKSWDGDLSALNKILNWIGTDLWNKRIPPLPWEFEDTILYQKAYNEWRGKSCAIILGKLLCIDNPLVRNKWAELFPYIPLASTADKIGKEKINSVSIQPSGGTQITDSSYGEPQSPGLYFAHTQEVKDISESLNKTYTPLDIEISPVSTTEVNDLSACHVLDVRSNQGDDLFPGVENNPEDTLIPDVAYTITEVPCTAKWNSCQNSNNPYCIPGYHVSCEATITIEVKMITKVPWADEIWSQTVADSASTFRKIFPKVEAGAPVECIADLPAATSVDYLPITQPAPRVLNPGDSLSASSELYFPHIGGIYEYFLKGIQTALRPQGYGGPITNGQYCQKSSEDFEDICAVAEAYNIPCCQLKGIAEIETGGGKTTGSGSCSTKNGTFRCCNGNVCGPSQVACGQYDAFAGNDKIDMCDPVGSAELLARAMLLKLCQADGRCDSYDWTKWGNFVQKNYKINDGDYTAAAYFYGLANGCTVSACTQYRWGPGKTYCDSVKSYCETGNILPDNPHPEFCSACNEELIRAGQAPIDCSSL